MKKYFIISLFFLSFSLLFSTVPEVSRIGISSDSVNVYINYSLSSANSCHVSIVASNDGGNSFKIYPRNLSGSIGANVSPGGRKQIVWNYAADNIQAGDNFQIKIIARDNPLDDENNFLSFTKVEGGFFHNGRADISLSDFFIDKYEMTQSEFEAVMGYNPSQDFIGETKPVILVKWLDTIKYCNTRSLMEDLTPCYAYGAYGSDPDNWPAEINNYSLLDCDYQANGYRLPTEMEWMFAAKGGNHNSPHNYNQWAGTNNQGELSDYAWYEENNTDSNYGTKDVGQKEANELGLYDMSGNAIEWCQDFWQEIYPNIAQDNPTGPSNGGFKTARGGDFGSSSENCSVSNRFYYSLSNEYPFLSFRLARGIESTPLQAVANPSISPASGLYYQAQTISFYGGQGRPEIYYTLDGSDPDLTSTKYTSPFEISETTTIKARAYKQGWKQSEIVTSDIEIEVIEADFVYLEGGSFFNGSGDVAITPFYINKYEVNQADYTSLMGANPSSFAGDDKPVDQVSWFEAVKYCNLKSIERGLEPCYDYNREGTDPNNWSQGWDLVNNESRYRCNFAANGYRLPTEMEWMFAAKGGLASPPVDFNDWPGTNESSQVGNYAWYNSNASGQTHSVGSKTPNQLGLYDMAGNVAEWCWDKHADYTSEAQEDPQGGSIAINRIYRGGSWLNSAANTKLMIRNQETPDASNFSIGFRTVRKLGYTHLSPTDSPDISPDADSYRIPKTITLSSQYPDIEIYYTLDGSDPNMGSEHYDQPFTIYETTSVKARAYKEGLKYSEIVSADYEIELLVNDFVSIEGGSFYNGTSDITISNFFINRYEITQGEYEAVMGNNPSEIVQSYGIDPDFPVYMVSWFDAIKFCNIRSIQDGLTPCYSVGDSGVNPDNWPTGWNSAINHENVNCDFIANGYRLPTEMEWMYAAKGGNQTPTWGYDNISGGCWNSFNNTPNGTKPVGLLEPNALGLYDMSGNVYEWTWDIYGDYPPGPQLNPWGAETGEDRITRGGAWNTGVSYCTVLHRQATLPSNRINNVGFRLARSLAFVIPETTPNPIISPLGGDYDSVQTITMSSEHENAEIYFTIDGSEPDRDSFLYTDPFYISVDTSVKARAFEYSFLASEILTYEYNFAENQDFVYVPSGSFTMGAPYGGLIDEEPTHEVQLNSFYISKFEVSLADYYQVMQVDPSSHHDFSLPLDNITWQEALSYCNAKSIAEELTPCYDLTDYSCDFTANGYRLPTEAEWEYAARGASMTPNYLYSGSNEVDYIAWYSDNSNESSHPSGLKAANQLGLYDMSGNVGEWCYDRYQTNYYENFADETAVNPIGPDYGPKRVYRGGDWNSPPYNMVITRRYSGFPHYLLPKIGIRLVRSNMD